MTTHENIVEHELVRGPSNRAFGLTVGGVLLGLGFLGFLLHFGELKTTQSICLVAGASLVALGLAAPQLLTGANRAWMRLGLLLSRVVSPVVMFLVFAVAVVPTGFIMRARGRDGLRLRRDPTKPSYWIQRSPPGPAPESMSEQF